LTERTDFHVPLGVGLLDEVALCVGDVDGFAPPAGDGEAGAVVLRAVDWPTLPPGAEAPVSEGEAKVINPGSVAVLADGTGDLAARDGPSEAFFMKAIAITQVMTVARASTPASQSLRVPGVREVSGAQPFSQGWFRGGRGVFSGMRCSSSGAKGGGRGCEGGVGDR
jgi:hypothetical protein